MLPKLDANRNISNGNSSQVVVKFLPIKKKAPSCDYSRDGTFLIWLISNG
jgi:hypothetical protein